MLMKKDSRTKIWLIRLAVFISLFLLVELGLRMAGFKPKILINWAYMPENIVNDSILYGDQYGISHYVNEGHYKPDSKINKQGFIGTFDYDSTTINTIRKTTGKKIVMAIGDSYLDGCCSDSMANSFAGYLSNKKQYAFLNYGIAGADPVQYKLIVEHLASEIKPDLIVIHFYFGNDILTYDRTPKPFIPLCYIPIHGPWLNSEPPYRIAPPNYALKDFNSAIEFYQSWYTLRGKERSGFLKFMGNSILFSKLYLGIEYKMKTFWNRKNLYEPPKEPTFTYKHLKFIETYCKQNGTQLLIVGIPSPVDVRKKTDLRTTYHYCFNEIPWTYPTIMDKNDYDGKTIANHFNNKGHKKFAAYLHPLILDALKLPVE
jgi:hypothetical protein